MSTYEAVVHLIAKKTGIKPGNLPLTKRLFHDLGISGNDAGELLEAFAEEFHIDFAGFDFSEYFGDEAESSPIYQILFWKRARKARAPLTVGDLVAAAVAGTIQPIPHKGTQTL